MIPRRHVRSAVFALAALLGVSGWAEAQKAIVVVRHAERQDDSTDSPLSEAGKARAARLATMLRDAGVTTLCASQWQRTQQTLAPLAAATGLKVDIIPGAEIDTIVAAARRAPATGVVVIAAHSDTAPKILAALGVGEGVTIASGEYDNLFLVVPSTGSAPSLVRLRF